MRALARAAGGARQQQRGEVHAENQQHRTNRPGEEQETAPGLPHDLLLQRDDARLELHRPGHAQLAHDVGLHRIQLRLGLRHRRPRPKPGERDPIEVVGKVLPLCRGEGRRAVNVDSCRQRRQGPQLVVSGQRKSTRQHANDRVRPIVQHEMPAEDRAVAAEALDPEPVRQHDHRGLPLLVLERRERSVPWPA